MRTASGRCGNGATGPLVRPGSLGMALEDVDALVRVYAAAATPLLIPQYEMMKQNLLYAGTKRRKRLVVPRGKCGLSVRIWPLC